MTLVTLFIVALLAATLFPAQSEAVFGALVLRGEQPVWLLLAVATSGNVLGSVVNWLLGRFAMRFSDRRWFPVPAAPLARAQRWYARRGWIVLFGSWLPVVGDPLTLVAGLMREPFWRFLLIVTLAKSGRYLVIALAMRKLLPGV